MKYTHLITAFCFVLFSNHAIAQESYTPDRPGIGNGSYVLSLNSFSVETGASVRHTDFGIQVDLGQLLLRYGVLKNVELRALLNSYSLTKFDIGPRTPEGFQNVGFGAKYNVGTLIDGRWKNAISAEVSFPVGNFTYASDKVIPSVTYLADYKLTDRWRFSSNIGYSYGVENRKDVFLVTATPNFTIKSYENATIYFGYAGIYDGNTYNQHFIEFGGAIDLGSNVHMDINTGYEADKVALFWGLGFSVGF